MISLIYLLLSAYFFSVEPRYKSSVTIYDEVEESSEFQQDAVSVEREDGIYLVINSDATNHDLKNLQLADQPVIDEDDIESIMADEDFAGRPVVVIKLKDEAAKRFEKITKENISKPLAIVFDGLLLSAPVVNEAIPGGSVSISGNLSQEFTQKLAGRYQNR